MRLIRNNMVQDYKSAILLLNTLQSNFAAVQQVQNRHDVNKSPDDHKDKMLYYCNKIGYNTTDFDKLNVIHIAGTKGKGSTSSFISSILSTTTNLKIGLYTSPHLRFVRERIQINNVPLTEDEFTKYFYQIWSKFDNDDRPIYFHFLTLMAFHTFFQNDVNCGIIECGIGGEFDTTNILLSDKKLNVITSLGIDHIPMLGKDLKSIAWHKAGIFKKGIPAITCEQKDDAMIVLKERSVEKECNLKVIKVNDDIKNIKLGLKGDFQYINASLAVEACRMYLGKDIDYKKGLETVKLGGRCEIRRENNITWYIDGAHTRESINVATNWFNKETINESDNKILIFNQQTRNGHHLLSELFSILSTNNQNKQPFNHVIFCTNTTFNDLGYSPDLISINTNSDDVSKLKVQEDLAESYKRITSELDGNVDINVIYTIQSAIEEVREISKSKEYKVFVIGSLHLVGGVIDVLETEKESSSL